MHIMFPFSMKKRGPPLSPFTSPKRRKDIGNSERPSIGSPRSIRGCICTSALMPLDNMPRTFCSGCINCLATPPSPSANPRATRLIEKSISTNARPTLSRAWRALVFAIVERPNATPHNPPEFRQLRDAVAMREAAAKQQTRLVNQLHGLLARVFPELAVHVKDLSASYVLTLLDKYPTPDRLARAKLETLVKIPRLDEPTANTLRAAAKGSLGSNQGLLAEQMVRQKVREIRAATERSPRRWSKLLEQAWEGLPDGPHRRILSIKGIGIQTAAALVAKIVSASIVLKPPSR